MDLKEMFDGIFGITTPDWSMVEKRKTHYDLDLEWFRYLASTKPAGHVWISYNNGKEQIVVVEE